jgi:predicted nucleotidyltransferase
MIDFHRILKTLVDADVDFIVVGGVAAVLQGAPIHTNDLDILYSLEPANQARLLGALQKLGAIFRDDPRRIEPNLSHLASRGHKLLTTSAGKLDCLGTIEEHTTYDDILEHVDWVQIDDMRIRVISLPRLIQVKEKLTRPKDQLALLQLRATLEEREAKQR